MASVELSLDEIIALSRKNKRNEAPRHGSNHQHNQNKRPNYKRAFAYQDLDHPEETRSIPKTFVHETQGNPYSIIRINLSNLAPSVTSSDLEELFGGFNIEAATVHYNEQGDSLGTGDVFLRKRDALRAMETFEGVALDNEILRMVIVDSNRPRRGHTPFTTSFRGNNGFVHKRRTPNRPGQGNRGNGHFKGGNKQQKSLEELDAELDAYMKKPNL